MEVKTLDKATSPLHKTIKRKDRRFPNVFNNKAKPSKNDKHYLPDKPGMRSVAIQDDFIFKEDNLIQERMNMYLSHERRISDAEMVMQCFRQIYPEGEKRHKRCPPA
ncbi:uncharacterized protein LOC106666183 [Cimex lectularius]|uniref:Uncharacterized protein n=1 Tax=Cimex lectularius TaxID=79782 RepID=A0A8I6RRJ3_CIMLE|nr:uncharacterized protein LOC106666183 [Cimex lectularius]